MNNSSQVTFTDIAANDGAGIDYRRQRSASDQIFDQLKGNPGEPTYGFPEAIQTPVHSRGIPGIAIFDFDNDGDEDVYVTNGPGKSNSLYSNQLIETGSVSFIDVAATAGVGAIDQDSTGICVGDIDNDGDRDLMVLGNGEPNRLFENQGNGSFIDISASSGVNLDHANSNSCSMGDINNDGLLDIVIANAFDLSGQTAMFSEYFSENQPNQLLLNQGNNTFVDVSESSGFRDLYFPSNAPIEVPEDAATITWAIAMVDYDGDGDIDIIQADDQGPLDNTAQGGIDRSYLQLFNNDGTGNFTNVTAQVGLDEEGGWMGLSFGDYNRDGLLDFFATNFGNHAEATIAGDPDFDEEQGDSRWFLQNQEGTFTDPGATQLFHTPFGWGASSEDYDNDGDTDIIYHGAIDLGPFVPATPGAILNNNGSANFQRDAVALANSTDHLRRNVHGVATGDLNNDGFIDIVSASNFDFPEPFPLVPAPQLGGEWDVDAFFLPTFTPIESENFVFSWNGFELPDGTLSVEINNAENGNNAVQVELLGTAGLTAQGKSNRDGIGALVSFQAEGSSVADMRPILGGSSYASQDSLIATFGLGNAERGTVEILWPGGVRTRIYDVEAGERLLIPEIPVSFDGTFEGANDYQLQVSSAIAELVAADLLTQEEGERFFASGVQAFMEENALSEARLFGGPTDDQDIVGTEANEYLFGRSGNDIIAGGLGDDALFGGQGDDVLRGDLNLRDSQRELGGDDLIYGGAGNDRIGGKGGNDTLLGEAGDDWLWGDDGDDIIRGGLGNDTLSGDGATGNEGRDTFVLAIGEGSDIITDFEVGIDVIGLADGLTFGQLSFVDSEIRFGDERLASLRHVLVAHLTEADFVVL